MAAAQLPTFVTFVSFAVRFCAFGGSKSDVPFVLVDCKNFSQLYTESLSILRCFRLTSITELYESRQVQVACVERNKLGSWRYSYNLFQLVC